jgi:hypothetical protein
MERQGYFTLLGLKFKVVWKEQFFSLCRMESKLSNPQFSELTDKKVSLLSVFTHNNIELLRGEEEKSYCSLSWQFYSYREIFPNMIM